MGDVTRDEKGRVTGGALNPGGRPRKDPEVVTALAKLTMPAVNRLERLAQSDDEKIALPACLAILDRNGFKPTDKLELSEDPDAPLSPHASLTLAELKAVARAQFEREKLPPDTSGK